MKVDVVVDVGNTRIKWGRCDADRVVEQVSLSPTDVVAWELQVADWAFSTPATWLVAGVHPQRVEAVMGWLTNFGQHVRRLSSPLDLPLRTSLPHPERAGIDRLLNAVAANQNRSPGQSAIIIDAGSAVTVDWVDGDGVFRGGAIFPGLHLMLKALHDYTALLPLIELGSGGAPFPGTSTTDALRVGAFAAVTGGIDKLVRQHQQATGSNPSLFLTGGDAACLASELGHPAKVWPEMTLEGLRLAAAPLN